MEGTGSAPRLSDVESETASGAAASSSARPTATRSSGRVTSAPAENKKKRQSTLAAVVLPRREDVIVLAGAPKASRASETGSAARSGTPGRKRDWIHPHWEAVDKDKYKVGDPAAEIQAFKDNAVMQCLHCKKRRKFNPSTNFKDHLLGSCPAFADSKHWEDADVQEELAKRKSKVCGKT
jgi:hypothetical protein